MKKLKPIEVRKNKTIKELLEEMMDTAYQGKSLAHAYDILRKMINDEDTTILLGYSGSLSTAGQWKLINWLIENNFVDIIVSTGANISEDIIEAWAIIITSVRRIMTTPRSLKKDITGIMTSWVANPNTWR